MSLLDVIKNGVRIVVHEYDVDRPAHAHVTGRGREVHIGPNGHPLTANQNSRVSSGKWWNTSKRRSGKPLESLAGEIRWKTSVKRLNGRGVKPHVTDRVMGDRPMTLRSDLAELFADAGISDVDIDEAIEDGHFRSLAYQRVVSVIAASEHRDRDRAVLAKILRDPEEIKSKTAVVAFVDKIALKAADPDAFRQWSAELMPEMDRLTEGNRTFVHRRIHDWLVYLSIEVGHLPTPADLADVTNWMQRILAEESTSQPLLNLLAESGSTKKIRNIAKNRAGGRAG